MDTETNETAVNETGALILEVPRSIVINIPQVPGETVEMILGEKTQIADLLSFALKERLNNDCGNAEGNGKGKDGPADAKRLKSCRAKAELLVAKVLNGTISFKAGGGGSTLSDADVAMRAVLTGNKAIKAKYGKETAKAITSWETTIWPELPVEAKARFETMQANRLELMAIEAEAESDMVITIPDDVTAPVDDADSVDDADTDGEGEADSEA